MRFDPMAALGVVAVAAVACSGGAPSLPDAVAGMGRVDAVSGVQAERYLAQNRLGDARRPETSELAHYAGGGETATVFVGRYSDAGAAGAALEAMLQAIRSGGTPLGPPEQQGRVWRMGGAGGERCAWQDGPRVIWVEGSGRSLDQVLEALRVHDWNGGAGAASL